MEQQTRTAKEERRLRVEAITDRLYRRSTENFLYKTVQKSPSRLPASQSNFAGTATTSSRLRSPALRTVDLAPSAGGIAEEFDLVGSAFFHSLAARPQNDADARRDYRELMRSFKTEAADGPAVEEVPAMPPRAFRDSIILHTNQEKQNAPSSIFKNEEKALNELVRSLSKEKRPSALSSFVQSSISSPRLSSPTLASKGSETQLLAPFWRGAPPKCQKNMFRLSTAAGTVAAENNKVRLGHKKTKSSLLGVAERSQLWLAARSQKLAQGKVDRNHAEMVECTFGPKRVTKVSRLASPYESAVEYKTHVLMSRVLS